MTKDHRLIDVRSPGEYNHAHMPGAYNLPLFTDEERKVVGTAYKQESREAAIKIGLDFFGTKMRRMIEEVQAIGNQESNSKIGVSNSLLIYCWRGGMRSSGVGWLMDLYGFKIYTLIGGYKSFRNYVLTTFKKPCRFNILGGLTGAGKTETLKELERNGYPVIDLEELAKHKGSAFGNIGQQKQPTQEMFENVLAAELWAKSTWGEQWPGITANSRQAIWLEDESQRIGLVNIPNELWQAMRRSPLYFLDISFENRLEYLVKEYGDLDKAKMIEAILRIQKRLGGVNSKNAILFLEGGNIEACFQILLTYYDKHYLKGLHNRDNGETLLINIECSGVGSGNVQQIQYQFHENY